MGNPCKGGSDLENELTFFSQPTFVLAMPGLPGTFVFMADQWEPEDLSSSRSVSTFRELYSSILLCYCRSVCMLALCSEAPA